MITKLVFLFTESIRTLIRAKLPTAISSITIAITLIIFSLAYFAYINIVGYTHEFKSKYKIEVFFESDLEYDKAKDLFNTILISKGIEQGEFIDKNKASNLFQLYFNENIIDIIGENPLPMGGQYDISIDYRTSEEMSKIVRNIRLMDGVSDASFQSGVVTRIDSIVENVLGFSIIMGIIIFSISIILVSNTFRLIIHAKKDSIETLHLLGAGNTFIKLPFLIEAVIQGFLGASFSLLILYMLYSLQSYLFEFIIKIPILYPDKIILYNISFGIVLALIGSFRGLSKYLPK